MDLGVELESGENSDCNPETKDTECLAAVAHIPLLVIWCLQLNPGCMFN